MPPEYTAPDRTLSPRALPKPKPNEGRVSVLARRTVTNLPVRVPAMDWSAVVTGQKRIFRCYAARHADRSAPVIPPETECPRPCLLFAVRHQHVDRARRWEAVPGVLLSHRQEPLGAITPEDLRAEGFATLADFRFYWQKRYRKLGWRPWDLVSVVEVRPWSPDNIDSEWAADWALEGLYGEWL